MGGAIKMGSGLYDFIFFVKLIERRG
jgi:hypothetical protein